MQIGLQLPQWGPSANRTDLVQVAQAAEGAGIDSLWVSDHIVYPLREDTEYPYSAGGPPFRPDDGYLEALTTLAVIAGSTSSIRLGTSVLILPMRNLLLAAKQLATLDVLSGGRVSVAVGAGWWRAEFDALGMEFDARGAVLDEQLAALTQLWSHGRYEMNGVHLAFPLVALEPRPLQPHGLELWIGGAGPRAWRRVATSTAVGWHGIGYDPQKIELARAGLAGACRESGRDPENVRISVATGMPTDPEMAARRVVELAGLGLSQVVFIPHVRETAALLSAVEMFHDVARPRIVAELGP